ncbi:MAG: CoA transferase subunit A, partial [Candidatus Methylomirabilales bacterium]
METLLEGQAELHFTHPDEFREWVREHKRREAVEKLMTEEEAIARFVQDGAYLAYDFSSLTRGPQALIREIIRQRKRDLWVCAEFTLHETPLLVGAGCCRRIDVGFLGYGDY